MGALMKGCTFPGNTISCDGTERWGEMTETDGTAICAVSARTAAPFRRRARTPYTKIPAKTRRIAPPMSQPRFARCGALTALNVGGSCGTALLCVCECIGTTIPILLRRIFLLPIRGISTLPAQTVDDAEDHGDEEQRGHRGKE